MGPELYLFVHDAKTAEAVLKARQCLNKPAVYNAVTDALGADGLFTLKSLLSFCVVKYFFCIVFE